MLFVFVFLLLLNLAALPGVNLDSKTFCTTDFTLWPSAKCQAMLSFPLCKMGVMLLLCRAASSPKSTPLLVLVMAKFLALNARAQW